jgi:hypothetical protein
MSVLTNAEQDTLVKVLCNDSYFEIVDAKEWALSTVGFDKIPAEIFRKLNIAKHKIFAERYKYSEKELRDEEHESGFHVYWDKVDKFGNDAQILSIGMYVNGGGDFDFDFTLENILDKEYYDRILSYGFDKMAQA